jgi:cytochrome P450
MEIFFTEFLRRLPQVELDGPAQRLTSNFINGINHLPLRWATA